MGLRVCSLRLIGKNGYEKCFDDLPCWSPLALGSLNKARFGGGFSYIYAFLPAPDIKNLSYLEFVFRNSVFSKAFKQAGVSDGKLTMSMNAKLDTRFLINALVAARTPYEKPEIVDNFNKSVEFVFLDSQTSFPRDQHAIVGKDGYNHAIEYNSLYRGA